MVDSIHGASGHEGMIFEHQQYQLFASAGAIKFPAQESEAWKEKVDVYLYHQDTQPRVVFNFVCKWKQVSSSLVM